MWRRLLFIPPLAIGIAVLALVVSNRPAPARKPPQEEVRVVRVMQVRPLTLQPRITGYGTVRPARVWNAIAQVGGKVMYTHPDLKKGAIIPAGTEIITIAPDDYRLAIAQAEANIRATEAKLAELDVNERNTRSLLELERQALEVTRKDYERKKALKTRGTIPDTALEQALKALIAQRKLVQSLENTLRLIPVQRRELREQLAILRSQLATARLNLERTHIRMPFTGRISMVGVEVGQFAPVGRQLAAADGIAKAEVEAQYPLQRMRSIMRLVAGQPGNVHLSAQKVRELIERLGLSVEVRLETGGVPVVWKGRFARLSDTFDPKTRTLGVIGEVDDPYSHVSPGKRPPLTKGMFVRMDILTRKVEGVLAIPRAALHQGRVFVVNAENRLEVRPVKVRARMRNLVIIGEGLKAGERIVLTDLVPAMEGQLLKPVPDEKTARMVIREATEGGAP